MAHPKRLSKRLQKEADIQLNRAQRACATMFGYKDWHELEQVTAAKEHPPSKPDWLVSTEIGETRHRAFCHRLFRFFEANGGCPFEYNDLWHLLYELAPTGSIPDDPAFHDARLSSIFAPQWHLTEEACRDFDVLPPEGFCASVGEVGSRTFETMVSDALKTTRASAVQACTFTPRDEVGYRTFAFSFPDRARFRDIRDNLNAVAVIPFRFIPTIVDDVMLELELALHPGAIASSFLDGQDVAHIADAICAYLHDSAIWAHSNTCVTGAANGIHITLSGGITNPAVLRVLEALVDTLEMHDEALEPHAPFCEDRMFLPIRELTVDLENEVSEESANVDFLATNGDEFVRQMVLEAVAMSQAPAILERLLAENGFAQYAEFCRGLDVVSSLDDKRKFVKFVCSMVRAKALDHGHSLLFRHDIVSRMVGSQQSAPDPYPDGDDASWELSEKDIARHAAAARALGDDELALMIEQDHEEMWEIISEARDDLMDLIMEFAPEEDPDAQQTNQDGGRA